MLKIYFYQKNSSRNNSTVYVVGKWNEQVSICKEKPWTNKIDLAVEIVLLIILLFLLVYDESHPLQKHEWNSLSEQNHLTITNI